MMDETIYIFKYCKMLCRNYESNAHAALTVRPSQGKMYPCIF